MEGNEDPITDLEHLLHGSCCQITAIMGIDDTNKLLAQGAVSAEAIGDGSYLAVKYRLKHVSNGVSAQSCGSDPARWKYWGPKCCCTIVLFLVFGVTSQGRFSLTHPLCLSFFQEKFWMWHWLLFPFCFYLLVFQWHSDVSSHSQSCLTIFWFSSHIYRFR